MASVERNANHFDFAIKNPAELLTRKDFVASNAFFGVVLSFLE